MKAECRALQKKYMKASTMTPIDNMDNSFPKEYVPFISIGMVSLLGSSKKISVPILQDIGVAQSLILEDVLPFSSEPANGEVMLQGVELGHVSLPLHNIYLQCDLVVGPVTVLI